MPTWLSSFGLGVIVAVPTAILVAPYAQRLADRVTGSPSWRPLVSQFVMDWLCHPHRADLIKRLVEPGVGWPLVLHVVPHQNVRRHMRGPDGVARSRRTRPALNQEQVSPRMGMPASVSRPNPGGTCRRRTARLGGQRDGSGDAGQPSRVPEHAPVVPGCGCRVSD